MLRTGTALAVAIVLACCASPEVGAQAGRPAHASATPAAAAALAAPKPPASTVPLSRIAAAIDDAERGKLDPADADPALRAHPLFGWIEYAALWRQLDTLPVAEGQAFLERYRGQPVGEAFREAWLAALSRRQAWKPFLAAWAPRIESTELRCAELQARAATGTVDAAWIAAAQGIWRGSGKSLPDTCDPVFATLQQHDGLTDALRWERLEKAAAEGAAGVMRVAAKGLPDAQAKQALAYAAFIDSPGEAALQFPNTARSRAIASYGLAALARSAPDRAHALLQKVGAALDFTEVERGRVAYQVARWTGVSYLPEAAARFKDVPAGAWDQSLYEMRVREALARKDWASALAGIEKMPAKLRNGAQWSYFEGRLLELTGDKAGARVAYERAAREPVFHGFLAADRIGAPYALCPWEPQDPPQAKAAVAADPAITRAMQLYTIDRKAWALREWNDALARFDDTQRRLAVEVAQDHGWFDRAVFALGKQPQEQRLYALRFPLHHGEAIRRESAKHDLDPAWVAAEIRAESVFDPKARSGANARGLMQVLPSTGLAEARRLGIPWNGVETLYDPEANIAIGTAYLRKMLDRSGGKPYFAMAGYNAGPSPLKRWQAQRPDMDADFWIETISYHETRDYVARVLAFSTIYDWRLNGDALPLTARMEGRLDAPRKKFVCPAAS